VLYALGEPAAFAGLVVGFLLAVAVRTLAVRAVSRALRLATAGTRIGFNPRHDVDAFGAVAALLGGLGWGRAIDVGEVPRFRGRFAAALVFLAGPLALLLLGVTLVAGFALAFADSRFLLGLPPSAVLVGVPGELTGFGPGDGSANPLVQFALSVAVVPLCFGVFALLPVPPLDGFGLLWNAFRRPGPGLVKYKDWFADKNIGVAVLLASMLLPFLKSPLYFVIDTVAAPLMIVWT
jgi:hypothetical protein